MALRLRPEHIAPSGQWVAHNPKGRFDGYRVVRLMMPWVRWRSEMNDGVLDRMETWPERRFYNEVMGLPFDAGTMPITEQMIRDASGEHELPVTDEDIRRVAADHQGYLKFAGLDWAMQSKDEDTPAYTIFGVFALVGSKLKMIYGHRFMGKGSNDPEYVLKKIMKWMDIFGVIRPPATETGSIACRPETARRPLSGGGLRGDH